MSNNSNRPSGQTGQSVHIAYYPTELREQFIQDNHLLAMIHFNAVQTGRQGDSPELFLSLPQLGKAAHLEVWLSDRTVFSELWDGLNLRCDGELLFGSLLLEPQSGLSLTEASEQAYWKIFANLEKKGYPYLLRIWNYFPGINENSGALERYQAFCVGRHEAFSQARSHQKLPAATAIGSHSDGVLIYFLASKTAGIQIENPRQVSAFLYPDRYSPKSPSFSRAILHGSGAERQFYVSGTASIVGHASRHPGDTLRQLEETLQNLQALIGEAGRKGLKGIHTPADFDLLKIYLRRAADYPRVANRLEQLIGPQAARIFLQADICRRDLLLEIDAFFTADSAG
jgi:chorismate lyase/3-hydroxybenzoate synthase